MILRFGGLQEVPGDGAAKFSRRARSAGRGLVLFPIREENR